MIDVRITAHNSIDTSKFNAFKMHAGVSDTSRDTVLTGYFENAVLRVSRYADRALVECSVRLETTGVKKDDLVYLYMHGSDVTSVKDGKGATVEYDKQGSYLQLKRGAQVLVIEYTAAADTGAWAELGDVVNNYALALYQQASPAELDLILKAIPVYYR